MNQERKPWPNEAPTCSSCHSAADMVWNGESWVCHGAHRISGEAETDEIRPLTARKFPDAQQTADRTPGPTETFHTNPVDRARSNKLNECLLALAQWAILRSSGAHKVETTLTLLNQRTGNIERQVYRAGQRAAGNLPVAHTPPPPPNLQAMCANFVPTDEQKRVLAKMAVQAPADLARMSEILNSVRSGHACADPKCGTVAPASWWGRAARNLRKFLK